MDRSQIQRDQGFLCPSFVREQPSLAVRLLSDMVEKFKQEHGSVLEAGPIDERYDDVTRFLRKAELLRDAVNPDAILSPGQQRLLMHHLQFSLDNLNEGGLGTYQDLMVVINFINGSRESAT